MTKEEFIESGKIKLFDWLRLQNMQPKVYNAVLNAMQAYADQQTAEKDTQLKDLHQWIKELEAKVYFYREATDKVRELVSNSKEIGLPNQPLYDAIFDRIKQLEAALQEIRGGSLTGNLTRTDINNIANNALIGFQK